MPDSLIHEAFWQQLYIWQTLITGLLALGAAWWTVRATQSAADREVAAAQLQTAASLAQTRATALIERRRIARQSWAFMAMLSATMGRVLDDAEEASKLAIGLSAASGNSVQAYQARNRIKRTGFSEIMAASIEFGGQLTEQFLRLDGDIDVLAGETVQMPGTYGGAVQFGIHAGLDTDLLRVKDRANAIRQTAIEEMKRSTTLLADTEEQVRAFERDGVFPV